jgi:hypothetical protein
MEYRGFGEDGDRDFMVITLPNGTSEARGRKGIGSIPPWKDKEAIDSIAYG